MEPGPLSLLPAAVTILVAVGTRQVAFSLFCGVCAGALAAAGWTPQAGLSNILSFLWISFSDLERLKIAAFILLMGGLLRIISESGAYLRFAERLSSTLRSPRRVRLATFGLSLSIFFDDYANVLISGASLRTLAARFSLSPALPAYIVDQLATVVSIMLLSTWAAFEGSVLVSAGETVGLSASPASYLVRSLPYHAGTWLGLCLAFTVALTGRWVGARLDYPVTTKVSDTEPSPGARASHAFWPLFTLVLAAGLGLGGSMLATWLEADGASLSAVDLLGEAPTIDILLASTGLALLVCGLQLGRARVRTPSAMGKDLGHGMLEMVSAALVIILSKGLTQASDVLQAGPYLVTLLGDAVSASSLPALTFLMAGLITVATGFSWSAMAIVMPVAFKLAMTLGGPALIPLVSGATISGAIAGGLMVPYSDTSVMTAAAFGIPPTYHVRTQLPQVVTTCLAALLTLGLLGQGLPLLPAYLAGLGLVLLIHRLLARG